MLDSVARAGYRLAYQLLQILWWLRRPRALGVAVAVIHAGELLVVRQSFRKGLGLPAGGRSARESPLDAARRELAEETGLRAGPGDLVHGGTLTLSYEHRSLVVDVFTWDLVETPHVRIDDREIIEAQFMDHPRLASAGPLHPSLRWWLQQNPDRLKR